MTNDKLIVLNIILDYPVQWSRYKVLRDFIQNFYDALAWKQFDRDFSYERQPGNVLKIMSKNTGFSYEWLLHMGASTKRESPEKYAGYFGEGFKVAALCAMRDFNWKVKLSAQNWFLEVTSSEILVDNQTLASLAYKVKLLPTTSPDTVMTIANFYDDDFEIFKAALYSFYYLQNPLMGEIIWENQEASICYRSQIKKLAHYPASYGKYKGQGIVFGSYLALSSIDIPLVFSLHNYPLKDRDREVVSEIDVVNIITGVVKKLPPRVALLVLPYFKRYWYAYPREKYGHSSFYTVVKNLVYRIYISDEATKAFLNDNPSLLVLNKVQGSNIAAKNKRSQALSWLKYQDVKYTKVQDGFSCLGYPTLEDECEKHDGFSILEVPSRKEQKYINLLEGLAEEILGLFFYPEKIPRCKIIKNDQAAWMGVANSYRLYEKTSNIIGLKFMCRLSHVAIKKNLLHKDGFDAAIATYFHELCHCFGGDGSANFSRALTEVMSILLKNLEELIVTKNKWHEID